MMKRIKLLFMLIIMFIIPFGVFAKTAITDTKITNISIPENWQLITKENMNEMMDWLGLDSSQKITYKYIWNNDSYYADIVKDTKDVDIILISKISNIDYEDISIYQYDLDDIQNQIKKTYGEKEVNISSYRTASGIKYYEVNYVDENNIYINDILTTIHGNVYIYRLKSSSEITDSIKSDFKNIVNSVEYDNYLEFIEKNKIELEEKKDNSSIILIIVFVIIIIVGVVIYILINKKKTNKNVITQTQVYNPVNIDTKNPAVADFIESTNLENNKENINPSVSDFLNQDNKKNQ